MSEISKTDWPVWLKIMERGAAGEARTKAFLLDRFWVLERSVDIDGADFLIQPRSLSDRFTDRSPPKVGVVQAKYFQDCNTTHHIPCRYVLNNNGQPLKGFFAVLHLGREDTAEMFLLSADEIVSALDRTNEEQSRFVVGRKALDTKFRVTSRRQALDKMAHEIAIRSPRDSFQFLDQINIPYRRVSETDIDYIYTLPVPNTSLNIPKAYLDYRSQLRSVVYDMEEALVAIDTILKIPDPRAALAELEKLDAHRGGDNLVFGGYRCDLNWSDLREALDEHENRVQALKAAGLLEAYVDLSNLVKVKIAERAEPLEGLAKNGQGLWASLDYDPATLSFRCLDLRLLDEGTQEPTAALTKCSHLVDHAGRYKISMLREANNLWHGLMTDVLVAVCPEINKGGD